ncbi:MAG: hypothetical protein ACFFDF_20620 [Candidatus Odinarchaeota archaeon]
MELENIFEIGRSLGACKIWTIKTASNSSPFYQTMPSPLYILKYKLKNLEIQKGIIKEIENIIKKWNVALDIAKKLNAIKEGQSKKDIGKLETHLIEKLEEITENLIKRIPIWEDRIMNELINIKVVKLSTDTNLNPKKLSSGVKSFFDINIWNKMSDLEKDDLEDSCRCISLQAWTPAGMIAMRVVESVFRNYYQNITSNDPSGKQWGSMLEELKNNQSANQKLVGYFDYLKDIRNELQHPDKRLSQFEAEAVFQHAIYILDTIYS